MPEEIKTNNNSIETDKPPIKPGRVSLGVKIGFFIFLLTVLSLAGLVYVQNRSAIHKKAADHKQDDKITSLQSQALLNNSKVIFPKISITSKLEFQDLPQFLKAMVLDRAEEQAYESLSEDKNLEYFYASYVMRNTTLSQVREAFKDKLQNAEGARLWQIRQELGSDQVIVQDYFNVSQSSLKARVSFVQQGGDVKIIVKTVKMSEEIQ